MSKVSDSEPLLAARADVADRFRRTSKTLPEALKQRRAQRYLSGSVFSRAASEELTGVINSSSSVGDVDDDENLDLVITGEGPSGLTTTLYLGNGSGGFTEANAGLTSVRNGSSSFGDMDNDGNLDLVITGSGTATLYLGDGSGGFTEANAGLTGVEFSSSSVGDVDNDGNLDLVITGQGPSGPTTTLYLGDGSGGFTEANAGLTGVVNGSLSFGDMDNDGNLDLVITGESLSGPTTTLYLGDGSGGFSEANAGLVGVEFSSSSVGDVDNDGNLDLVVTGDGPSGPTTTLYLGDGSGGFTEADTELVPVVSSSSSLGDVDNDGNLDLIITGESDGPSANLYFGDGSGSFTLVNAELTGVQSGSSSFGDVDNDENLDLLITGEDASFNPTAKVYENVGDLPPPQFEETIADQDVVPGATLSTTVATKTPSVTLSLTEGGNTPNVSFTDQGDGTGKFTFAPESTQLGQTYSFTITATNLDGGTSSTSFTLSVTEKIIQFADLEGVSEAASDAADVDGDGTQDLLVAGDDSTGTPTTTLYLNDGDGTFTVASAGLPGVVDGAAQFADVDADDDPDLILTGETEDGSPLAALYENDGSGNFSEISAGFTDVRFSSVSVGDVGQDGDLDVLIAGENSSGGVTTTLYENDGTGSFSPFGADFQFFDRNSEVEFADPDNNGALDVWVSGDLYLGGFGGFNDLSNQSFEASALSSTDIDGDGDGDIILTDTFTGEGTALFRNDNLDFTPFSAGLEDVTSNTTAQTADLNGDAAPDALLTGVTNEGDTTATLYRNLGDEFGGRVVLSGVANGSTTFFDVDDDGDKDLLVAGSGTATVYENAFDPVESSVSKMIASDGTEDFGATGTSVSFDGTEGSGDVRVDRFNTGARFTLGIPSDATVANYRFTIVSDTTLSFAPTTELRLNVSALGGISEPSTVTIYQRPEEGSGAFEALETTYNQQSNELVAEVSRFSEFTLASTDPNNPLPVELSSFEAQTVDEDAVLTWTTASETNNAGFTVQHRADSTRAWEKIGFVESKGTGGTTADAKSYRFRTDALEVGTHRFRLQQVDTDGTTHVSRSIKASVSMQEPFRLTSYPNPVQRQATVEVTVRRKQEVQLQLYDVLGRRIATLHDGPLPAQETRTMTLQTPQLGLSSGTYFLRLVGEKISGTRRLTIVR